MNLTVIGEGLTAERVDAMQAGLSVMSAAESSVIVTDTFVATVNDLTGQLGYSTDRGAGVVAARTIHQDGQSTIVVNAPEVRNRIPQIIERLMAHEAGHVHLNQRKEGPEGRRHLVRSDWEWWLLCVGGLALDEFRIERALADLGYPVSDIGSITHAENGLYRLNLEVIATILDPASSDARGFAESIMRTHDWLAKQLAYFAAFRSDTARPGLADLSADAQTNWRDYIGSTWEPRIALYEAVPAALTPIGDTDFNQFLSRALEQEVALLAKVGFRYTTVGNGFSFDRVASDAVCESRRQRAVQETERRERS